MERYYKQYDTCRQNEAPFCSSACPFHLDVLKFQQHMMENRYNAAFKLLREAMGFPQIAAELCEQSCASVCPRKATDQPVQLNLLEKTCVKKADRKDPPDYNVPAKPQKIAIIGAGLSGLGCALRLTQKKYDVTIYEKSERYGGSLWDKLDHEIITEDIERQFQFEKFDLFYHTEINDLDEIRDQGFEAVYTATGKGGCDFGAFNQEKGHCTMSGELAVWAGGELTGKDSARALADGMDMARVIEHYLKTKQIKYPNEAKCSRSIFRPDLLQVCGPIEPTDHGIFTDEEAVSEAGRCIRCQCSQCMENCDVCAFYKKWPLRIRDDVMATVAFADSKSLIKKRPAKRLINTCTQCGMCQDFCPENIEMGALFLEARRSLHKRDSMPGAFHQFWVRDMEFSNSEHAALVKNAPKHEKCAFVFFPGCQLGAADPRYVEISYKWLLEKRPDTGLMLQCCGIPADWAGNEQMHEKVIVDIQNNWTKLGKPTFIYACPSCGKHLKEYLPEIELVSLYELFDQWGGDWKTSETAGAYSVFDPCSARNEEALKQAVRSLAKQAEVVLEELPKGDFHGCCGYGGNGSQVNEEFTNFVVTRRSRLSNNPYLVYCSNCADIFREKGKPVRHILDVIFGIDTEKADRPSLTKRRQNRVELKNRLLCELWKEKTELEANASNIVLLLRDDIREKMERYRVLEQDICEVIASCEASARLSIDPEQGTFSGYMESGYITIWVEYYKNNGIYHVVNVYTHRMEIVLEAVWDGKKTYQKL